LSDQEQTFGEASVQADQGYQPMADAYVPPEDKRRFTPDVINQEIAKLRASFIVPPKGRPH
jgi:hypothetical protein